MAANQCKCFICDTMCMALDTNRGINIASILTMPLSDVLEKCLRIVTDVEYEYFCISCTAKIEEYDRLMWQSRRIEKELHEHFQNKSFEIDDQRPIISNGIIFDRDRINEVLINMIDIGNDGFNDVDVDRKPNIELINLNEEPSNGNDKETKGESQSDYNGQIKTRSYNQKFNSREVSSTLKSNEIEYNKTNEAKPLGGKKKKRSQNVSCDYCGRTYRSKCALSVHIVKHIDKNPYECKVCQKTFTQRVGMIRHMAIHSGKPLHQCDVCGKRFIHVGSYHVHKKIHTNARPQKCTVCGSNFRSKSHLDRHMRTHNGEKPFACQICGLKFAQRYNLTTHQKTHDKDQTEPVKTYKCLICPQTFIRREKLNDHLVNAHQAIETSVLIGAN